MQLEHALACCTTLADGPPAGWTHAIAWASLQMGGGGFVFALFLLIRRIRFVRRALRAPGRVVSVRTTLEWFGSSPSGSRLVPIHRFTIEFTTGKGESVRFESKVGSSRQSATGQRPLRVLYDPDRPEEAEVDSFLHLWFFEILMGALGAAGAAVGWVMMAVGTGR